MTRHRGYEVRLAPEVERVIRSVAQQSGSTTTSGQHIRDAMWRLAEFGTRANGAKKLRTLDIWEIRAGGYRAYFCPVAGTNWFAVGALVAKNTRKHSMKQLRTIERKVHRWRDQLEDT